MSISCNVLYNTKTNFKIQQTIAFTNDYSIISLKRSFF